MGWCDELTGPKRVKKEWSKREDLWLRKHLKTPSSGYIKRGLRTLNFYDCFLNLDEQEKHPKEKYRCKKDKPNSKHLFIRGRRQLNTWEAVKNLSKPHSIFTKVDLQLEIIRADAFPMTRSITKNILQVFLFQMKVLLGWIWAFKLKVLLLLLRCVLRVWECYFLWRECPRDDCSSFFGPSQRLGKSLRAKTDTARGFLS